MICEAHIERATKVALHGDVVKAKMSAVAILPNGRIIASAANRKLPGDPFRWSAHCEEELIRKLIRIKAFSRFKQITIFVFRISPSGVAMAKPCKRCQLLLKRYPVKVFYTTDGGQIEKWRE